MVTISYGSSTFWHESRLAILVIIIVCGIKFPMQERIHSEMKEAVLGALVLMNAEGRASECKIRSYPGYLLGLCR